MYYHPLYERKNTLHQMQMMRPKSNYIRVLHAVPNAPNVDVYANDQIIAENLAYGEYTEYMEVPEGDYEITLYETGKKETPIVRNQLMVTGNPMLTIAAVSVEDGVGLLAIRDCRNIQGRQMAMIRFGHLSPDAPAVDITLPDGTVLFQNVSYMQVSPYMQVPPGVYTLQVRVAGTPTVVKNIPDVSINQGDIYTGYAIGLAGGMPELEALFVSDTITM